MLWWVSGTPFGSPEEPEVNISTASSAPVGASSPSFLIMNPAVRNLMATPQRLAEPLSSGISRSMRIRSRWGGHGKFWSLRMKVSAVMNQSTPDCFTELAKAPSEAE